MDRIDLNDPRIMDSKTATEKWRIDDSTLRKKKNDFPEGTLRKIGNSWAVTIEGMEAVFGKLKEDVAMKKIVLKKWNVVIVNDQAISIADPTGVRCTCHLERHGDVFLNTKGNQLRDKVVILEGIVIRPITPTISVKPNPHGNILGLKKEDAVYIYEMLCDMERLEAGEMSVSSFEEEYSEFIPN